MDIKKKIEAVLFSAGKFISVQEIADICKADIEKIKDALLELQADYESKSSSLVVLKDGDLWKLTTREEFSPIVRKIVTETELTKSQLETLAVIAFKYPIKQSDLIKIRTNKAYDHLIELEKVGFITRQKYSRSKLIKLTDKFFEYFDLPHDKLKERFKGFGELAKTIEQKESEIEKVKKDQKKFVEEVKKAEEKEKKIMSGELEIDLFDTEGKKHELDVYEALEEKKEEKPKVKEATNTLGELEVVDEDAAEAVQQKATEKKVEENQVIDTAKSIKEEISENDEHLKSVDEVLSAFDEESEKEETGNGENEQTEIETLEEGSEKEPEENLEEKKTNNIWSDSTQKQDSETKEVDLLEAEKPQEEKDDKEEKNEKDEEGTDLLEAEEEKEEKTNEETDFLDAEQEEDSKDEEKEEEDKF